MKILKSHFWFNKRQQNGIFFLLGIIVSLQFIFYLLPLSSEKSDSIPMVDIIEFQREMDSFKKLEFQIHLPI